MKTKESILCRLTQQVNGTDKELFTEVELNKFASFYCDKWDENTSTDVIVNSFVSYWWTLTETAVGVRNVVTSCARVTAWIWV